MGLGAGIPCQCLLGIWPGLHFGGESIDISKGSINIPIVQVSVQSRGPLY